MRARLDAELGDGRRVVLLDDRGWGGSINVSWDHEPSEEERQQARNLRAWEHQTVEQLEREARFVVGPDEPDEGQTQADAAAAHWDWLAQRLQRKGIDIDGAQLGALPYDVVLSDRVRARISGT